MPDRDAPDASATPAGRAARGAAPPDARPAAGDAPILELDPDREAVIEPGAGIAHFVVPRRVVICYFPDVIEAVVAELAGRPVGALVSEMGPNPVNVVSIGGEPLAVVLGGVGAPLAAGWLEELIALGGRAFIAVGGAGALVPGLAVGHVVVPTSAVRDEGTSYHYLPASREVGPTEDALAAILAVLERRDVPHVTGTTWTTDALYRETRAKVARRVGEGCLTVEMEAAAYFAVARFRGVSFGQLLYAGDDLSGEAWDHRDWMGHRSARRRLFDLAAEAVLAIPVEGGCAGTG